MCKNGSKSSIFEIFKIHLTISCLILQVSGIGAVGEAHLKAIGIETVGDLRNKLPAIRLVFASLAQVKILKNDCG